VGIGFPSRSVVVGASLLPVDMPSTGAEGTSSRAQGPERSGV